MYIAVVVYILRLADTCQTGADSTCHLLLQGNIALDSLFCRILLDGAQHRGRSAGVDHIRRQVLFPDRVQDIALRADASVLGRHKDFSICLKFIPEEEIFIPVS